MQLGERFAIVLDQVLELGLENFGLLDFVHQWFLAAAAAAAAGRLVVFDGDVLIVAAAAADGLHHLLEEEDLLLLEERDGRALAAGARRSANLVYVGAEVSGRVVEEHVVDVGQVHAARHHVRAHEHVQLVALELGLHGLAARRVHRRRVLHGADAVELEQLVESLRRLLGLDEAQHAAILERLEQVDGHQRLVLSNHLHECLAQLARHVHVRHAHVQLTLLAQQVVDDLHLFAAAAAAAWLFVDTGCLLWHLLLLLLLLSVGVGVGGELLGADGEVERLEEVHLLELLGVARQRGREEQLLQRHADMSPPLGHQQTVGV